MDNVFWVVIAAAVAIALAGIVLFIGSDSLQGTIGDAEDTQTSSICSFQEQEVESGRAECGTDIVDGDRCYDEVC